MLDYSNHNGPPLGRDFIVVAGERAVQPQRKTQSRKREYKALEREGATACVDSKDVSKPPIDFRLLVDLQQADSESVAILRGRMHTLVKGVLAKKKNSPQPV